jgi:dTDP-4-dehydrorhamnose reductase
MQKIIVTGAGGQLGIDMVSLLKEEGYEVIGFSREELDITNQKLTNEIICNVKPYAIVHCAAYTNVDKAEEDLETAFKVNAYGTRNIAIAAEKVNAKLIYISTDYVFDGTSQQLYHEFSFPNPINVYGESKLAGERFVRDFSSKYFILRTSWVYGKHGNNFVKTMLKLSETQKTLKVVSDQIGCPTFTLDIAESVRLLIETEAYGVHHVTSGGHCSWYEFAKEIFRIAEKDVKVIPCNTDEFPRTANRPKFSVLVMIDKIIEKDTWKTSLKKYFS